MITGYQLLIGGVVFGTDRPCRWRAYFHRQCGGVGPVPLSRVAFVR